MIEITEENKVGCCGCSACAQICPKNCIAMISDEEGFLYPKVDSSGCVGCNLCEKICPVIAKQKMQAEELVDNGINTPKAIGGWHKDDEIRYDSSSGGAFTLFAMHIIEQDGVVYGATLDDNMYTKHIGVETISELYRLRGSKYVQSDINGVYKEIKEKLAAGRKVLFVGTPCQAAGLSAFMEQKHENLYIVDFICHGVPSPKVFQNYIAHIEQMQTEKIVDFKFRLKDKSWSSTGLQLGTRIALESGNSLRKYPAFRDAYMNGFLDDVYLRPSCYECEFKCLPKYYADITIADFWGVDKVDKELCDGKGTSLILLHSSHGEELFQATKDDFYYKECVFEDAIKRNKSLIQSAPWSYRRVHFFKDYAEKPFSKVMRKYMSPFSWGIHKIAKIAWALLERVIRLVLTPALKLVGMRWTEEKWEAFFQFAKFALVGVSNTMVSYLINIVTLTLLRSFDFIYDYVVANIAAFSLSVLWSYYWNSRKVFRLSQGEKRSKLKTLLKTYASYAFTGFILNNALSTIWIQVLEMSKYLAPLMNLPFSMPVNFLINKKWAYSKKKVKE